MAAGSAIDRWPWWWLSLYFGYWGNGCAPGCSRASPGCTWATATWIPGWRVGRRYRSEEHTSELQSRGHLVCRLLLEKKKAAVVRAAAWAFVGVVLTRGS